MNDGENTGSRLISLLPAQEDGATRRRERLPVPVPLGTTDVRVEDLGDGRARVTLDLPWAVALLVLDDLAKSQDSRAH